MITSCTLKVDFEYPQELHDLHSEYPLAPENVTVNSVPNLYRFLTTKLITCCIIKFKAIFRPWVEADKDPPGPKVPGE